MPRRIVAHTIFCAFLINSHGCSICHPPLSECELSEHEIIVDQSKIPSVPVQNIDGCFYVSVARLYNDEVEHALILFAENIASTIGPDWFAPYTNEGLLVPEALNSEAIEYYAMRIRAGQRGEIIGANGSSLMYSAMVLPIDSDHMQYRTVRLDFEFFESGSDSCGFLVAGPGVIAWREIVLDQNNEVIEIRGDGEAQALVA